MLHIFNLLLFIIAAHHLVIFADCCGILFFTRHDSLNTRKMEDQNPQFSSHFTMGKVLYGLPTPLAHATPVHTKNTTLKRALIL